MHAFSLLVLPAAFLLPVSTPARADAPLDAIQRRTAVEGLARALRAYYVVPDVAERAARTLQQKVMRGFYTEERAEAFAATLTEDLQTYVKDRHLRVRFDPAYHGPADPDAEPTAENRARFRKSAARQNFGVSKVEVLPGNVGLVDLRSFIPTEFSAAILTAAMNLVANTEALILDLRQNGGGDPETVAYLCSYFFPEGSKVHLNDIYNRPRNATEEFWTRPSVPGARYTGKPVYVLTSRHTFSGGEEFSYDLQTQKRATLIGETTGGGANPGGPVPVGAGFVAFIPTGRAINPITGTNWEGTGVTPDMATLAASALKVAHAHALRTILKAENDAERRKSLERTLAMVESGESERPNEKRD
jgi:Peptidase family S41/N-terminal domain of Peptidase_S41 in eukaryotic IRBP